MSRILFSLFSACLLLSATSEAADLWRLCPLQDTQPETDTTTPTDEARLLSGERLESTLGQTTRISGHAELQDPNQHITADQLQYNQTNGEGHAQGDVHYSSGNYRLQTEQVQFNTTTQNAEFGPARYQELSGHIQGRAERIEREGTSITRLHDASFSSCPAEEEDWVVTASELVLDHQAEQGTASHAVLYFQGVPFFYSPWFRFPIGEQRKSGFLTPSLGRSSKSGSIFELPYYWNIAPEADATITPRFLSERGTQLRSEFRYLTPMGSWQWDHEQLDDRKYGADRNYNRLIHSGRFGNWGSSINASEASDPQYFKDLANSLSSASVSHLKREASLTYYGDSYNILTQVQNYQTLDESLPDSSAPYAYLPRISYSLSPQGYDDELNYEMQAELVQFDRADSLTAQRINLNPKISYPLGGAAWFVTPKLSYRYTHYQLEDDPLSDRASSLDRSLPIYSLDSGLFFERDAGEYLHTLEPRLFYLHVPYSDQTQLPLFDSGLYSFSYTQLFRDNRFTGVDRIGDTQQLTLAVTSRYLEKANGDELFSISLGQIHYFADREVGLRGDSLDTTPDSDLIMEAGLRLNDYWSTSLNLQQNPDSHDYVRGVYQLQYRNEDQVASLSYRYKQATQEQLDLSFRLPLSNRWNVFGRWNRSILDDDTHQPQDLETLAGIEYGDCCWLLRIAQREYLTDDDETTEQSIYIQLVLKGLGGIGDRAGEVLEDAILGYHDEDL